MQYQVLPPKSHKALPAYGRLFISRERLLATLVAFVVFLSFSMIGLSWFERAITFHPVRYGDDAWSIPQGARDVWFSTADGIRLHGWLFDPQEHARVATVIYFHGNGGNIANVGWVGRNLAARGFQVLLFDYRGYGRSEGTPHDEHDIYLDSDAAYDFVSRSVDADSVVLYGQSLGTAAAADLASRRQCGAVILESGFSSASDMASSVLPWFPRPLHFLLRSRFESAQKLAKVKRPILITHGDPDPVIPLDQAHRLFAAANEPKKLIIFPGAGHNVFGSVGNTYLDQLSQFIREALEVPRS